MNHVPLLPASSEYVPSHLVWAIVTALFCCLALGIVSIVSSSQVDGKRIAGNLAGAREASRSAKPWAIWSAVAGPALVVLWMLFMGGVATLAALSSGLQ